MGAEQVTPLVDVRETEEFKEHAEAVEKALTYANRFASDSPIGTQEEANEVADAVRGLATVRKDAHATRLAATALYRATTESINADYNELVAETDAAEKALKDKGLAWQRAEEARAREKAKKRQEQIDREAEEKLKEMQEAAELAAEDEDDEELQQLADETRQEAAAAAAAPPVQPIQPPKAARGSFGRLGKRTVYRFDVTDEAAVPDSFKVIDGGLIKARIKAEADSVKANPGSAFSLQIPGVSIFTEDVPISSGAVRR